MNKVSAWWSSLGFGRDVHRPETDFADMGTAFGLDASFRRSGTADPADVPATSPSAGRESADGQGAVAREGLARR